MAALQFLAIAGYYASLRLALHHHKRTLHPVQLIFLGLTLQVDPGVGGRLQFSPQPQLEGIKFEAHFSILGCGLSSQIGGGENRGRTLEECFVVLSYQQTEPRQGEWIFTWPELPENDAERFAVVAWLTRPGSSQQVQATGGWLPQ
ncbi:MAG: hypothetical protein PVJ68_11955 [Candidatus Thiodiazotropha sp.]|jgi:hypothetical protein